MVQKFEDFTHLYQLSKTLRFEAIPVGETKDNIIKNGLLERDGHRALSYVTIKKLIDEYCKDFNEKSLANECLKLQSEGGNDSLEDYLTLYNTAGNKDAKIQEQFDLVKQALRDQIVAQLNSGELKANNLFGKELIESRLYEFINSAESNQLCSLSKEEAIKLVEEFKGFSTYFSGFFENRKNMYTAEEKSTGIAHRIINENLPKFIDNMKVFEKIAAVPEMQENFTKLYSDLSEYLNVESISELFQLAYYNTLLTQKQIEVYNAVIGGKTAEEGRVKVQGINEYVNLYNQQHKEARLPKLKMLFKQILSDRNAISWLPEEFKNDTDVLNAINDCYQQLQENVLGDKLLKSLIKSIDEYDTSGIYIKNDIQLTDISQKMFGSWNAISDALFSYWKTNAPQKKAKENEDDYEARLKRSFNKISSFSIRDINHCISLTQTDPRTLEAYYAALGAEDTQAFQCDNIFSHISNAFTDFLPLLNSQREENTLAQNTEAVTKIKNLLDSLKSLQRFVKPLLGNGDEGDKDEKFYGELTALWEELDTVTPLYNKVRNYMTRKPYSQDKIKLNFDNATLLAGWDENKESDNSCIILRKDGKFYLAIMDKEYKKMLKKKMPSAMDDCYEKMVYKLLPGANKMLPKVFFAKSNLSKFNPSEELLSNYARGTHKKGKEFKIEDCHALIDYFKESIEKHEDWSKFDFHFSDTSSYEDMSDFYREVEQQGYKITFSKVSKSYIDNLVKEGKMYLFQIYNKDFSESSKGTPNMHTLYWKALFNEKNLCDVVYKLNGQAEIFFREKSIKNTRPTHPANQPIANKNKNNQKKESTFTYDLIKDKRYTMDKYMFHVPITINFKSTGVDNINTLVREYLKFSKDTHIIGIDRGERHLLYLVVIDQKGNIVEQYTLNEIVNEYKGNIYKTDYHDLLDSKEESRMKARQSWQTIENIKELKEGYLSQVVHKITQLMVKYHAIVVLEDLNKGFMRGRQKVEKQVYQKFEKMLIDKLNYLVDKNADPETTGGVLNAYQLTSKFESFQKLGKQSGFLFYIPAWNTSKIDPVTGFVNLLDTRYQSITESKAFFSKFDCIRYIQSKDWFEFTFDYTNFTSKAEGTKTKWTLCTYGKRIKTFRNEEKKSQWDNVEVDLTAELKTLFSEFGIDINGNLKDDISNQTEKRFFEELHFLLKLTLQMRNSITGTDVDYLVSPVADENGDFYDSRTCEHSLPENADANGAYNIARKGLMAITQIQNAEDFTKVEFDLSNRAWLKFAQDKPYGDE